MQEQPIMVMSFGLLCLGVMAMLFIAMIVGTIAMLASIKDQRVWDGLRKAAMVGVPILAGVLFLAMFVGVSSVKVHQEQAQVEMFDESQHQFMETVRARTEREVADKLRETERRLQQQALVTPIGATNDLRPADALAVVTSTKPAPTVVPQPAGDLRSETKPSWLQKGITKDGDVTTVVLASPLFATEQEADESTRSEALAIIEKDLLSIVRSRPIRPRTLGLFPTVLPYYETDRFVEMEQRDLGTVTAPMYRVWKKLELSPRTREQGLMLYRTEASQARFALVGAALLGLLTIPVGVLVSARGTRLSHGRGKRLWQTSAAMLVLGAWVAGFLWLRQFVVFFS